MSARDRITVSLEDVGGAYARFLREAPKVFRQCLIDAVDRTAFAAAQRMRAMAPVGPDAPHIRDFITTKRRGLVAQVGYIDATQSAGPNNDATIAEVALYNEYRPNAQPFMRPAAEGESKDFVRRVQAACGQAERSLSGGGGLL